MFSILVIIILISLVYLLFFKPFKYWKKMGVPQYDFWTAWYETWVFISQGRPISDNIQKIYNDFPGKRYCGQYQFFMPSLVLRDTNLIKQITIKDFDSFMNHIRFVPENTEPLWEKNLFSLQGDKWKDMRAILSPSFTSSKMKILYDLVTECAIRFVMYFEKQEEKTIELEMKNVFTRYTNDVIASTAFGVTVDSMRHPDNEFYLMGKGITDFGGPWKSIKFMSLLIMPKFAKFLGLRLFPKTSSNFFIKLLKENIQIREKENIKRPDMLNLLLDAKKNRVKHDEIEEDILDIQFPTVTNLATKEETRVKRPINDEDIVAQALIFFFAGFESVSTLMSFLAYELAVNVDVQKRLQKEIDDTMKICAGVVLYENLYKTKYMDMVILEALRKWPGALATERVCEKHYIIEPIEDGESPVYIQKGDAVMIPIFGVHRDPKLFPEPDRFNPERFNDENKANILPHSFLAFGSGPRSCIGNRFAMMETKIVFFHLLSKFDIVVIEKTNVPLKLTKSQVQLSVDGGIWLGLRSRKN